MSKHYDWQEDSWDLVEANAPHLKAGRFLLGVDDGTLCHTIVIRGKSLLWSKVQEALADYAAGYRSGPGDEIGVTWALYGSAGELMRGRHTFPAVA